MRACKDECLNTEYDKGRSCGVMHAETGYVCTRLLGHKDDMHVACWATPAVPSEGHAVQCWERKPGDQLNRIPNASVGFGQVKGFTVITAPSPFHPADLGITIVALFLSDAISPDAIFLSTPNAGEEDVMNEIDAFIDDLLSEEDGEVH